jgi:hypothetical protein
MDKPTPQEAAEWMAEELVNISFNRSIYGT